jgi:hypothetical protein
MHYYFFLLYNFIKYQLTTVVLLAVLNLAFSLSVLGFMVMHISLVSANTTTIEVSF